MVVTSHQPDIRFCKIFADDRYTLDWLIDQGVDVNKTNTSRQATGYAGPQDIFDWSDHLLNNVAANGDFELFDHLGSRGADPHRSLALHDISRCRDEARAVAMVRQLLDKHNMNIDSDNEDMRDMFDLAPDSGTPLCVAACYRDFPVLEELLRRGANPKQRGKSGIYPLNNAIGTKNQEASLPAIEALLGAGVDPTSVLVDAAEHGKLGAARMCLRLGADLQEAREEALRRDCELAGYGLTLAQRAQGRESIEDVLSKLMAKSGSAPEGS
ncbi:hypothetical protein CLAFUW4_10043 [Fulvia fulva]|uniref:Uncharacterized protein n=1 Tax=Passalora fulva TaxID=5499 RepID=A0A9Q8PHJ9_PASFU|nr:uncharacterized protein CLAFUR5_12201 [Fulvia fulva]KAK4616115.1 hypothetical protein CLAFUR4_10047 [Fulvia fulva]KAK4616980.1 hypothetical protein CLAFUR0_10045 [Fulvia fulva]UJO22564.1 hypothetical protein CLAFUR5_12201 [Fulvia fulva]WPV18810.1 hypothetical protein CLAFUW4_10043 [Fulvia fulva]WPV34677.1 hypothetical protein CLAFUW7_10044 [Fulvia fulva]